MTIINANRDTLRALADEGNELALDRLADLADQRADLDELNELLDEGCLHAGHLLTARALTNGDLLELQRLSDAGCDEAGRRTQQAARRPHHSGRSLSVDCPTTSGTRGTVLRQAFERRAVIEGYNINGQTNYEPTDLSNLVSLCRPHHRAVHEQGWRIRVADGVPVVDPPS